MTAPQTGRIFISYRRADSAGYAGRIYDRLAAHFGKEAIFMDVDTIQAGLDFVEVLQNAVQSCDVLIALIGSQWLNIKDEAGELRLDNPQDFVRIEVAAALTRGIRVFPVLVDGTPIPSSDQLPKDLKLLTRRNAVLVNHYSFHNDLNRLIEQLELALKAAEESKNLKAKELREEASKQENDINPSLAQLNKQKFSWKFGKKELIQSLIGLGIFVLLYFFFGKSGNSLIYFRSLPAIVVPLFFGLVFGPVVGGVLGAVIYTANGIFVFYQYYYSQSGISFITLFPIVGGLASVIPGVIMGLVKIPSQNYRSFKNILRVALFIILANLARILFSINLASVFGNSNPDYLKIIILYPMLSSLIIVPISAIIYEFIVSNQKKRRELFEHETIKNADKQDQARFIGSRFWLSWLGIFCVGIILFLIIGSTGIWSPESGFEGTWFISIGLFGGAVGALQWLILRRYSISSKIQWIVGNSILSGIVGAIFSVVSLNNTDRSINLVVAIVWALLILFGGPFLIWWLRKNH